MQLQSFHALRGDGLHGNQCPGDARLFLFFSLQSNWSPVAPAVPPPEAGAESHHKSEPFRPSLTSNPTGISELGDCAALFPKYRSDFSASAVFSSQQNWSEAPGAEAHTLETEACLFRSGVNICRLEKKKKESEDRKKESVVLMLLERRDD